MGQIFVKHVDQQTSAPAYDLYRDWPRHEISAGDLNVGYGLTDTFVNAGGVVDTNVGGWGGWKTYEDTGGSILPDATGLGIELTTDGTDNDEVWMQAGYSVGGPFKISDANPKPLIFCASFKVSALSAHGVFIGLAEPGLAAANTIADAGTLADKEFIGFFRPEGDVDGLDFVYQTSGESLQTKIADCITLEADTWYTVGFYFDGNGIVPYYNGKRDYVNRITAADIAADEFPDAESLNILMGQKNGAAAAHTTTVRFVECQQLS